MTSGFIVSGSDFSNLANSGYIVGGIEHKKSELILRALTCFYAEIC